MSNRTLIEINHDYCKEIEELVDLQMLLGRVMRQGANGCDRGTLQSLWAHGIRVYGTRHHTDHEDTPLKHPIDPWLRSQGAESRVEEWDY